MWAPAQPLVTPHHYYCEPCDVYGVGDECWECGSDNLYFGKFAPSWTHSHRHDPSKKSVSIGDGNVQIRRELKRLV